MELAIVLALWGAGVVAALGIPAFILLRARLSWTRLPHTRAFVQGEGPPPASQDDALLAFADAWRQRGFDGADDALRSFERLHIAWREGQYFTQPDVKGPDGELLKMRGRTLSPKHMIVAIWDGAVLGDTAFFHELTHVALWVTTGEADPDHKGDRWPGWTEEHDDMIRELKSLYRLVRFRTNADFGVRVTKPATETQALQSANTDGGVVLCGTCAATNTED
jgi:hypothetical protein